MRTVDVDKNNVREYFEPVMIEYKKHKYSGWRCKDCGHEVITAHRTDGIPGPHYCTGYRNPKVGELFPTSEVKNGH